MEKVNQNSNNEIGKFIKEDFAKSGISEKVILDYVNRNLLTETSEGWTMTYMEFLANKKTNYKNTRLAKPRQGKGKYIKSAGVPSRIFRPIHLPVSTVLDPKQYLILTEGDKKAIKAVQEGFICCSLAGVNNWKTKSNTDEILDNDDWEFSADIIPDLAQADFKDKQIILCYDNDLYHNPKVKHALYSLSAYLISEKEARVKLIFLPKGEAKGLDDFLTKYGKEEFKKLLDNAKEITLQEIQKVLSGQVNYAEFPLDIFPEKIKELIIELHKRLDAPIEYIASTLLMVVSILMDGHYELLVNPGSNWKEFPLLWMALVGNPSQKKTPCLNIGKEILNEYDCIFQSQYEIDMSSYNLDLNIYKANMEQYKKALKKGEMVGKIPEEPEKPQRIRLITQDVTKESLAYLMNINSKVKFGLSIFVDELASFLKGLNQYKGKGNDIEYFLASWAKDRQNIVRKSDKTDYTFNASHNIIGTIQPKVLDETIFANGIEMTNGLIERWLYVFSSYLETGILHNAQSDYDISAFKGICQQVFSKAMKNPETVHTYTFSTTAQELFRNFYKKISDLKKNNQHSDLFKSYLEKQNRYVARFALILHAFSNIEEKEISDDTFSNAMNLSKYFLINFKALISNRVGFDPLERCAVDYLKTKGLKTISATMLHKNYRNKFRSVDEAKVVLEKLSKKGYGRLNKAKNGCTFVFYGH